MAKAPAFQFYPGDWRRDLPLQSCSLRARGLWHEMLCLMHEGVPYGYLTNPSGPILPALLSRLVHAPLGVVVRDLHELEIQAVFSRTEVGVIYSRRMVRDQAIRAKRAAGGYQSIGHPHTHPPKDPTRVPSYPPPASSSSSASASALPGVSSKKNSCRAERPTALRLLGFLNEKTGRTYQPVPANVKLLEARLREGATEANIRGVIARKVREWQGDPKMAEFLRPKTLFNATNFAQYLGQREAVNGDLPAVS